MLLAMARAMVLSAGLGTRLRPLTAELPKPLLPLGDRPLLEHAFDALRGAGLGSRVVVNTHHLPAEFERRRAEFSLDVVLVHEPALRGSGGGIAGARAELGPPPIVVLNADVVLGRVPPDFAARAADGGMVLAVAPRAAGSGSVGLGRRGEIVRLRGERFGEEIRGGDYVGLLALGARALAELPEYGCYIADYALPRLRRGESIASYDYLDAVAFPCDDIPAYWSENLRWLERLEMSFVGRDAEVEAGVTLVRSLIGGAARVLGTGRVERTLVLPGATARAPLADAIVLPSGRVVAGRS